MNTPAIEIAALLAAPFDPSEIRWKPQAVSGNRALAVPYVSARAIQERLDAALGIENWRDQYEPLPDGSVVCTLSLRINSEWISKADVGSPSEQPDEGDRKKAAFSDALKRAAVKWSIARYLYGVPKVWVDFDPQKRQFVRPPTLPAFALPAPAKSAPALSPMSGADGFAARLRKFDERIASTGLSCAGECLRYVLDGAAKAALPSDMLTWNESHQAVALGLARAFEADRKKGAKQP
jgi:hypothetical protein